MLHIVPNRKLERKYFESFEMRCWRRMEKKKSSEKVINEQVLDRIGYRNVMLEENEEDNMIRGGN